MSAYNHTFMYRIIVLLVMGIVSLCSYALSYEANVETEDTTTLGIENMIRETVAKRYDRVMMKALKKGSKGDLDKAISLINKAIDMDSSNAEGYYNRAYAYLLRNETKKAIEDLSQAIRLDSAYTDAYLTRGLAYADLGSDSLATTDFTKAIELDSLFCSCLLSQRRV